MVIVNASDFDEAYSIAVSDMFDEILEEMINTKNTNISIEYGNCIPFVYKGCDDCEYQQIGEFDFSIEELMDEIDISEIMDFMFSEIDDLNKQCNSYKEQLLNCLKEKNG